MARLIDRSVLIQLERRGGYLDELNKGTLGEPFALASITATELLAGVSRTPDPIRMADRSSFVEAPLRQVPIIAFDLATARIHARMTADLASVGQPIATYDLMIAATAMVYGYDVVTHNRRRFNRFLGLNVIESGW
jgi:predicted nucleic acid-binding protein